jgi:hypothetical protein
MAPDLGAVRSAYEEFLGYQVSDEGQISSQLAEVWGAPACSDRSYILMQPEASQDFCFRFVEVIEAINYKPLTTFGWNAAELIVQDVDSLAERLVRSPFKIIGQPEDLSFSSAIRAMQVIGPAQEVLYLTQFKQKVPEFQVPDAESFVGETFIAILGGAHIAEIEDFYGRVLGVPHAPIFEAKIAVLSEAFGLPAERVMTCRPQWPWSVSKRQASNSLNPAWSHLLAASMMPPIMANVLACSEALPVS